MREKDIGRREGAQGQGRAWGHRHKEEWDGGEGREGEGTSRFKVQSSRFTIRSSRSTVHGSRSAVHGLRFTIHGSRFAIHGS